MKRNVFPIKYFLVATITFLLVFNTVIIRISESAEIEKTQPTGILPEDILSLRDINTFSDRSKQLWLPPSEEYIQQHTGTPPDKRLLPSFLSTLRGALKPEWIPSDIEKKTVYLQNGKYFEALQRSFFYISCTGKDFWLDSKGFYNYTKIIIKRTPTPTMPAEIKNELQNVAAFEEKEKPGLHGPTVYSKAFPGKQPSEVLKDYIRNQCELFLDRAFLPKTDDVWNTIIFNKYNVRITNGGISVSLYGETEDPGFFPGAKVGKTIEILIKEKVVCIIVGSDDYEDIDFTAKMEPPVAVPEVKPLNSGEVDYLQTNQFADSAGGAVSEENRASWVFVRVTLKKPIEIKKGFEALEDEQKDMQGYMQVHVPLTPLKWQLCEYLRLLQKYRIQVEQIVYSDKFEKQICDPKTRKKAFNDFEDCYASSNQLHEWLANLRYPAEVFGVHNELLSFSEKLIKNWQTVTDYWKSVLAESPDETKSYYLEKAKELGRELGRESNGSISRFARITINAGRDDFHSIYEKYVR